jgi:CRP/FNR family transcriptional regulator
MTDLLVRYPSLAHVSPPLDTLPPACGPHLVQAGQRLFDANQPCQGFPLVLSGEIKVVRQSHDGRSLELYRVTPGELCLVSSASLFHQQPLTGTGITTRPTQLLVVPGDTFHLWLDNHAFRAHVLGLFAGRMAELTALVDAVAFHKLDQRLATALLGHGPELVTTHQALADQLGTVREIVSRLLNRFEQDGWVQLSREHIRITNPVALRNLAGT